jgi:hypothetical protein
MDPKNPTAVPKTSPLKSGAQLVADFVTTIGNDNELDKETVQVIVSIFREKFTTNNLLRALESVRVERKDDSPKKS